MTYIPGIAPVLKLINNVIQYMTFEMTYECKNEAFWICTVWLFRPQSHLLYGEDKAAVRPLN